MAGLYPISTLEANRAKSRFGVAYVRAVCAQAGLGFLETSPDEDVLAIDCLVWVATAPVMVQVKCTSQFKINGGRTATWPVELAWREKWQKCALPVYFVLVVVDEQQMRWMDHHADGTVHRAAAFWVRVNQLPEVPAI